MDVSEICYEVFSELALPNTRVIRVFHGWRALCAGAEDQLIIIDDYRRRRALVFSYGTPADRDSDVEILLRIPEDGDGPAGQLARLRVPPPAKAGSAAAPWPDESALQGALE